MQSEELVILLNTLKGLNIHIALETTLFASEKALYFVLPYIDFYIIDLKLQPQMKLSDSSYFTRINYKLSLLCNKRKCFRLVFVDEVLDYKEVVLNTLQKLKVDSIELLLYHNLGEKKYAKLAMKNQKFIADINEAESFRKFLSKNGINSSMLSA